jgi:hypothetical protein
MCALIGAVFAGGSVIWEVEQWGLAKQTALHFALLTLTMLPIAWFSHWIEHSLIGFLLYLGIFIAIYLVIWIVITLFWSSKVRKINQRLN